ncbi:agamous-like MADS-box protein AGL65 [Phalaenopsis equestris]|uniref:agamous-like MADS-box protein AGL65 n=1 Tax=Phalaenopsis equestris TaxID=78828 RepID=UPI0009E5A89F|nr:agamous-like MADS-box protein AGL65 [Phalaenopsis equestris]
MGRAKLQIKKLESNSARNATYTKRRAGILKKAKELSILCDIEVLLLMFSPNGNPTLCLGEQSNLVQMISKFYQLSPQGRENSKLEILETLRKTFKNLDHDVKIEDFIGSSARTEEELTNHLQTLKAQLAELELRLSYWTDPGKVQSIDQIQRMEHTLRASLNQIQIQKASFGNQLMPLCNSGQNSIPLPMAMSNDQQSPHMQWIHGCDGHHLMRSEDAYLMQRNFDSSAGIPLQGFFDTQRPECSRRGPGNASNDLNQNSCLQVQLGVHNPYQSYDMNYPLKFYQQPNTGYDTDFQTWASSFGSRGMVKFHEHLYAQTQNPVSGGCSSSSNTAPWRP